MYSPSMETTPFLKESFIADSGHERPGVNKLATQATVVSPTHTYTHTHNNDDENDDGVMSPISDVQTIATTRTTNTKKKNKNINHRNNSHNDVNTALDKSQTSPTTNITANGRQAELNMDRRQSDLAGESTGNDDVVLIDTAPTRDVIRSGDDGFHTTTPVHSTTTPTPTTPGGFIESTWEKYTSCRWGMAYLTGLMTMLMICLRSNISMALVCMSAMSGVTPPGANHSQQPAESGDGGIIVYNFTGNYTSPGSTMASMTTTMMMTMMMMTKRGNELSMAGQNRSENGGNDFQTGQPYIPDDMQGVILSSYYYGYLATPYLGGVLAERFGSKRVISLSALLMATFTCLTPFAIRLNTSLAVLCRVLLGFVSGVTIPSATDMWKYWAPLNERALLTAVTFSGISTGVIMANFVSGFLCNIQLDEGWPFIFYVFGGITYIWLIAWEFLAFNSPETHPRIRAKEKLLVLAKRPSDPKEKTMSTPPVRVVFTSLPFLSLLIVHVSYSWCTAFLSTYLPLYLNDILLYDTQTNGVLSSLPFLARVMCSVVFASLSDFLTTRNCLSITTSRKVFQGISMVVPGIMIIVEGYLDPHMKIAAVVLMVLLSGFHSAGICGFRMNHLDIAPRFAGSLSGITVTFACVGNLITPLVVSPMIADKTQAGWRESFILTAVISFVGALFFVVFGSGEEQSWAKEPRQPSRDRHASCSGRSSQYGAVSFTKESFIDTNAGNEIESQRKERVAELRV